MAFPPKKPGAKAPPAFAKKKRKPPGKPFKKGGPVQKAIGSLTTPPPSPMGPPPGANPPGSPMGDPGY